MMAWGRRMCARRGLWSEIPTHQGSVEYVAAVNLDWEVGLMRMWSIHVLVSRTDRVTIGNVLGRECQVLKGVWVRAPWEPPLCVVVGVLLRSPTSSVVSVGLWSVCLLVRC